MLGRHISVTEASAEEALLYGLTTHEYAGWRYMMSQLQSREVGCPYCGQIIDLTIDCSVSPQRYTEDCQVCCRPIIVHVQIPEPGVLFVQVAHENE